MKKFTITEEHLKLAKEMYVGWQDCEFGAPEIDPKRPYGNSYVYGDLGEILGLKEDNEDGFSDQDKERMYTLHRGMQTFIQIGLATGRFDLGEYEGEGYSNRWKKL